MPQEPSTRTRLRFADFGTQAYPDGRYSVRVALEWNNDVVFQAVVDGTQTREGETRAAAAAALAAAQKATEGRLRLELIGAKALRVFDCWVVIVSARGTSDEREYSLTGSYACPDGSTSRGAALAALSAVNRILQNYMEPD